LRINTSYNPNIPQATDLLAVSQGQLLTNFTTLNTIFNQDHTSLTVTQQTGYHKTINQQCYSTIGSPSEYTPAGGANKPFPNYPPTLPANQGYIGCLASAQVNDGYAEDQMLWYINFNTKLQLTSNFLPVQNANSAGVYSGRGYTFLAGGIVIQWGTALGITTTATFVNFGLPFAKAVLSVVCNVQSTAASPGVALASWTGASQTGFTLKTTNGSLAPINWIAIGI
jgi:hypothetical protein